MTIYWSIGPYELGAGLRNTTKDLRRKATTYVTAMSHVKPSHGDLQPSVIALTPIYTTTNTRTWFGFGAKHCTYSNHNSCCSPRPQHQEALYLPHLSLCDHERLQLNQERNHQSIPTSTISCILCDSRQEQEKIPYHLLLLRYWYPAGTSTVHLHIHMNA